MKSSKFEPAIKLLQKLYLGVDNDYQKATRAIEDAELSTQVRQRAYSIAAVEACRERASYLTAIKELRKAKRKEITMAKKPSKKKKK